MKLDKIVALTSLPKLIDFGFKRARVTVKVRVVNITKIRKHAVCMVLFHHECYAITKVIFYGGFSVT